MNLTVLVSGERTIAATVMRQVHSHLAALKKAASVIIPSPGLGFPDELQTILPAFELAQELAAGRDGGERQLLCQLKGRQDVLYLLR
jgi:hypothetical protein